MEIETVESEDIRGKFKINVLPGFKGPPGVYVFVSVRQIYDASMNETRIAKNRNKDCHMQLLTDGKGSYWFFRQAGRNGRGDLAKTDQYDNLSDALNRFHEEFRSRTGLTWENKFDLPKPNKYTFNAKLYYSKFKADQYIVDQTFTNQMIDKKTLGKFLARSVRLIELIFNNQHLNKAFDDIDIDRAQTYKYNETTIALGRSYLESLLVHFKALPCSCGNCDDGTSKTQGFGVAKTNTSCQRTSGNPLANNIEQISDLYYSAIPRGSGLLRLPAITNTRMIASESIGLDKLQDLQVANEIIKSAEGKSKIVMINMLYKGLRTDMGILNQVSCEFLGIKDYLMNEATAYNVQPEFDILDIYRVERWDEKHLFKGPKLSTRPNYQHLLLWHASPSVNFGSILPNGLRIPENPVHGHDFGKGIYFADSVEKTFPYTYFADSGNEALILLCQVEVGDKLLELDWGHENAEADCKAAGHIATKGIGEYQPGGWIDARKIHPELDGVLMPDASKGLQFFPGKSLIRNEYVVYNAAQVKIRYLAHLKFG